MGGYATRSSSFGDGLPSVLPLSFSCSHRASHTPTPRPQPHRQENVEEMLIREVRRGPRRVQPQQQDEHEWLPPEALRTEEEEVAAADAEAAWRNMQEQQQQQQQEEEAGHSKVKEPRYTQRLAAARNTVVLAQSRRQSHVDAHCEHRRAHHALRARLCRCSSNSSRRTDVSALTPRLSFELPRSPRLAQMLSTP